MIGDNVTEYDYQVIDKDGEVHNYIWDDEDGKMVEGKRDRVPPYWRINRIAEDLQGKVNYTTLVDSRGKVTKRIIIEYDPTE